MYKVEEKKILFYGANDFSELPYIDSGSHGDVYKIRIKDKDFALKIFNGLFEEDEKKYEEKLGINISSYISPLKITYLNDKFNGYLMKLCRSDNLYNKPLNLGKDSLKKHAQKLIFDTEKLSLLKYLISDTYVTNIMFDNGFKMIDMDSYERKPNWSFNKIKDSNEKIVIDLLLDVFIYCTSTESIFIKNKALNTLKDDCLSRKILFEEFIDKVFDIASNISDKKIEKMHEAGLVLRKHLNR